MDLKLKDVAQLLRISEPEVNKWLAEGKIPSYKIGDEIRFSRLELENWLIQQGLTYHNISDAHHSLSSTEGKQADNQLIEDPDEEPDSGLLQFNFYRAISRGEVIQDLFCENKEHIIAQTTKSVAKKYPLDADYLNQLLVARERLNPTGLGYGVAIPHARDFLINAHFDALYVVYPKEPMEWGSLDKQPVHTLFFLFACSDKSHLRLLAKIASFCQQKQHVSFLKTKPNKVKLLETILQWERQL